ncbi:MAG TPA: amidohydrolase [Candidatus Limnocylindria bacterium]|nr:amidohydrolase [Candidatus Limnocylindria bacterium]
MSERAELVIRGQVVLAAESDGLLTAEAIGISAGRVLSAGTADDVLDAAGAGAEIVDARDSAVIPGLHDFHIHLVGLARARMRVLLDDARDGAEVLARIREAAAPAAGDAWVVGRGWSAAQIASVDPGALDVAVGSRPAFFSSHDGHSGWASSTALRMAGIGEATADPEGGRIERDPRGVPTGVLRETARELVARLVPEPQGGDLRDALDATLRDLAALGLTGASEAGDYTDANGTGADAALGDSYSTLTDLGDLLDGRLRVTLGIPADALPAAAERGLQTGMRLDGRSTMRFGWAKEYADGALGSGTAALFAPKSCGEPDAGILRVTPDELDGLFRRARSARIAPAIHAIGDRAVATVLDVAERAGRGADGVPNDRMEHVQLLRARDAPRFAELGVTASVQPIHAAADRDLVESCWEGRQDGAYAWRSLLRAGAQLAAGSDAPVESVNPWLGIFSALHRRGPSDSRSDWRPAEALTVEEAVRAYTLGPAVAIGAADEGHLRPGARADLAILSVGLDVVRSGDERLAEVRSLRTLVDGRDVPTG